MEFIIYKYSEIQTLAISNPVGFLTVLPNLYPSICCESVGRVLYLGFLSFFFFDFKTDFLFLRKGIGGLTLSGTLGLLGLIKLLNPL